MAALKTELCKTAFVSVLRESTGTTKTGHHMLRLNLGSDHFYRSSDENLRRSFLIVLWFLFAGVFQRELGISQVATQKSK